MSTSIIQRVDAESLWGGGNKMNGNIHAHGGFAGCSNPHPHGVVPIGWGATTAALRKWLEAHRPEKPMKQPVENILKAREVREKNLIQPDEDWITTKDAAQILGVVPRRLSELSTRALRRRSRSAKGRGGAGIGYLWAREDIVRLKQLRDVPLPWAQAQRVILAEREGRV